MEKSVEISLQEYRSQRRLCPECGWHKWAVMPNSPTETGWAVCVGCGADHGVILSAE